MLLRLPYGLHYPITVTSLLKQPGDPVERDDALFWYVYQTAVTEGDGLGNKYEVQRTFPTKFESSVDGEVVQWKIKKGDVIHGPIDVVEIDEPCAHEIQFGGLCAECGKDMTESTYNTEVMDSMRAPIQMAHDNTALTVSKNEATRMEEDAKRRLLTSRKLSLVVDLDQTIIHATVDPTVGEWMKDKDNPNYQALSDVRSFQLAEDGPGMRGCWYYVKLRPGLEDFLRNISEMFELHIYTMGTRAYAQHIAGIIDPDRTLFEDRILSRDESGSLTAKNLQRLFPVDTKMVVIIDDRGDVWKWNPNLVKVSPYDFFVGIGDINSSFLPKKQELKQQELKQEAKAAHKPAEKPAKEKKPADPRVNGKPPKAGGGDESTLEQLVRMGGGSNPEVLQEQSHAQEETIMHQVEDRPLLQKQKELDAEEDVAESSDSSSSVDESQESLKQRHHLLEDNDSELIQLQDRLEQVHRRFYDEYERKRTQRLGGRVAALRGEKTRSKEKDIDLKVVPDVQDIVPQLKRRILGGVVLVFSGVLPLGTDTQNADISLWAKSFGAVIASKINLKTTHLVAGRNRTAKVREATRFPDVKIVTTQWLLDSLTHWKRHDEEPYLLPVHPDDRGQPISPGSKEMADSSWLSSSDDASIDDGNNDEAAEAMFKAAGLDDSSPIGYGTDEQAEVHEELKEFLGSDDESDSDSDMPPPPQQPQAQPQAQPPPQKQPQSQAPMETMAPSKKRKLEDPGETDKERNPKLGQRVRRSYPGSTALRHVASAIGSDTSTTSQSPGPVDEGDEDQDQGAAEEGTDENTLDEPAADDAASRGAPMTYPEEENDELEQEMLAALEDGDYDAKAEEDIAAENG
ncbi:hypothetical protein PHISP_03038 [Aspergillus sp. HF37]|nr:hypothetical protein PHISP_03038 [Aspergillus sp. HF37]